MENVRVPEDMNVPVDVELKARVIPVLDGWVSLPAAGGMLDPPVTRQRIYQMVGEGKFPSIHQILGGAPEDPDARKRPAVYVVSTEDVERLVAAQKKAATAAAG